MYIVQWGFLYNVLPAKDVLEQNCLNLESTLKNTYGASDINGNELFCELQHILTILEPLVNSISSHRSLANNQENRQQRLVYESLDCLKSIVNHARFSRQCGAKL